MVKTFYLNSLDAKKAVNLLRTMLQVKKIYVNEELNALVIRDNPELIDVAGKILEANDVPDAEVLLEVEVIQVSKNNSELFGLGLSRYAVSLNARTPGSGGDFFSDTFDPKVTTTSNDTTTVTTTQVKNLLNLFNWNGYQGFLTVPSATYNFSKQLSNAEVLSNPKIRVKNREKSKFTVGTRVPITTTSSTGSVGGVTVNVQYVDVGVKLNAEPVIQLNNEVTIKLGVEVSSIIGEKTVGSGDAISSVVTIGTRNVDTVLNLKDGETSIIGGLIEDSKSKSKQKIWLLGDIPLIGSLLSSHNDKYDKSELVLAITPRIVRAVSVPEADVAAFWSGKEDDPTAVRPFSSFELEPEFAVQPAATPAAKGAPAAPAAKPGPATPAGQPAAPAAAPAAGGQPAGTPATPVAASTAAGAQAVAAPVQPPCVEASISPRRPVSISAVSSRWRSRCRMSKVLPRHRSFYSMTPFSSSMSGRRKGTS
ncbi:secretin N-terminal domain-containing protein [Geobacter anodireducens]